MQDQFHTTVHRGDSTDNVTGQRTKGRGSIPDTGIWSFSFACDQTIVVTDPTWCPTDNYSCLPASYIQPSLKPLVMLRLHISVVMYIIVADLSNIPDRLLVFGTPCYGYVSTDLSTVRVARSLCWTVILTSSCYPPVLGDNTPGVTTLLLSS